MDKGQAHWQNCQSKATLLWVQWGQEGSWLLLWNMDPWGWEALKASERGGWSRSVVVSSYTSLIHTCQQLVWSAWWCHVGKMLGGAVLGRWLKNKSYLMADVLVTFPLLRQIPNFQNWKEALILSQFLDGSIQSLMTPGRKNIMEGSGQGKAAHIMVTRQRREKPLRETPFQVTPQGTS